MKKIVSAITDELIYGAHLVALGAVGITLSIVLVFDLRPNLLHLFIAYLIYLIIYSYNYFRELLQDMKTNPERVKHISSAKKWRQISPLVYILLLCVSLIFTNLLTAILVAFITLGGILYTEKFKRTPILGFKTYYVSFFWSILVLTIPFFYDLDTVPYLYFVLFIFIRGLVNTIFSDIKDIESDRERGIKTLPVYWGKKKTLYILQIINIISMLPLLVGVVDNKLPFAALLLSITIINGFYYLTRALYMSEKSLRLHSSILIDGEYIFWPAVIIIGKGLL